MPLTRTSRNDRRRRTMREAVAAESGVAVETVRARSRRRASRTDEEDADEAGQRCDEGYSQEVRYACQQRLVQLIPVRKTTMSALIGVLVAVWASLFLSHYLIYVRGSSMASLHIGHFFHMRSPHGLTHWLGVQFWMITGFTSLLILQLRRHKLDDYRAKYRIWIFLAIGCFFSSFDAASNALLILGLSIDSWTQAEFGYSGWSIVLASYASIVGVLGLRLCTELKSSPGSVSLWFIGLLAWAFSAVAGTGLFKLELEPAALDLAVGASWLGGIFCVFTASTLYLRNTYIQAQQRFALRNKWLAQRTKWHVPNLGNMTLDPRKLASGMANKFGRRSKTELVAIAPAGKRSRQGDQNISTATESRSVESTGIDRPIQTQSFASSQSSGATKSASPFEPTRSSTNTQSARSENPVNKSETAKDKSPISNVASNPKRGWWPRLRSNPKLGDDYSDLGADQRMRDQGLNSGFEKVDSSTAHVKQISDTRPTTPNVSSGQQSGAASDRSAKPARSFSPFARGAKSATATNGSNVDVASKKATLETKDAKRSRWPFGKGKKVNSAKTGDASSKPAVAAKASTPKTKNSWFKRTAKVAGTAAATATAINSAKSAIKGSVSGQTDATKSSSGDSKKRRLFGFLDGLTLKPPTTPSSTSSKPNQTSSSNASAPLPSTSSRPTTSATQASFPSTSARPSTSQSDEPIRHAVSGDMENYDDEDYGGNRQLSKAERKRMRRQGNDRAA